jgi:hypothetical protein
MMFLTELRAALTPGVFLGFACDNLLQFRGYRIFTSEGVAISGDQQHRQRNAGSKEGQRHCTGANVRLWHKRAKSVAPAMSANDPQQTKAG